MNNKHGAYFLKMYQSRSYVLALENAGSVDGMYVDGNGGLSFRQYGDLLLLGGGGHRTGKPGGGWAALEDFVKRYYPGAKERFRWATQDCMTLDGLPYIGRYSKHTPNLYVATGFNKWGMTSSMVAADLLGDLVQGRENACADLFSPSRSILRPQLACNALEAAKSLLTFSKPRCPHMGCALHWNPQEHSWDCPCHGSRFTQTGKLQDNPATDDLKT
jgi:glycine/D-amino acid oxidase-like deaminating enzyme